MNNNLEIKLISSVMEKTSDITKTIVKEKFKMGGISLEQNRNNTLYYTDINTCHCNIHTGNNNDFYIRECSSLSTAELLDLSLRELESIRNQKISQQRISFILSIISIALGAILLTVGLSSFYNKSVDSAMLTTSSGVVSSFISTHFSSLNKSANDDVMKLLDDMSKLERVKLGIEMSKMIEDRKLRDNMIADLIKRL